MKDPATGKYTGLPELGISPEEEELFEALFRRELRYIAVIAILVLAGILLWLRHRILSL